jgi:hypothetical protein
MSSESSARKNEDSLFSGRGSPALMSLKEPALKMLRERYLESFAVTAGKENQIHLFLIKTSLWALVRTFVPKDIDKTAKTIRIAQALSLIENALNGSNPELMESLDASVSKARSRITAKAEEFGARGASS